MPELNYEPGAVAIVTVLIIVFAFIFGLYPKKQKPYVPTAYWTSKQYCMHLRACIVTCTTMDELLDLHKLIKAYTTKVFSDRVSMRRRKKFQQSLIDTYNLKAQSLEEQKEAVCKS